MINVLVFSSVLFFNAHQVPQDSIGTETVNGKVFVIHSVGEKETLYGISRRYGTSIESILQYNPTADAGLEIGQILKVPYTPKKTVALVRRNYTYCCRERNDVFYFKDVWCNR